MNTTKRPPSLRSLKVFQVAGRHLSFKLAADELCILLGIGEWPDLVTYRLFARRLVVGCAPELMAGLDPGSYECLDG